MLSVGKAVVSGVARGIFLLFMTLMVAGYLMATRENIVGFFRSLIPARSRISFDRLLWRVDRGMSGVVRGQLLICAVNGVLSAIGYWMFDLKYWPILAILSAVMSIIPIFGSILSSVPVVLIGLTQDFWTALWVLLWIVGIHQVEANLLNPKIIGVAAKIHPVLVVLALIIGEHFFGLWGALLGRAGAVASSEHFQPLPLRDHARRAARLAATAPRHRAALDGSRDSQGGGEAGRDPGRGVFGGRSPTKSLPAGLPASPSPCELSLVRRRAVLRQRRNGTRDPQTEESTEHGAQRR